MKKIIFMLLFFISSFVLAGSYGTFLYFTPRYGSMQVDYSSISNKLPIVRFKITNSPSDSIYAYCNGTKIMDNGGLMNPPSSRLFEFDENNYSSGSDPYVLTVGLTNTTNLILKDGKKFTFDIVIFSNTAGVPQTNTFWFVLKDSTAPSVSFLDKNDTPFDESQTYSYVVSVKIVGQDTSGENVTCYYTIDGSNPTTNSVCFTNSKILNLGQSSIIKVLAKDLSGNFSSVNSKTIKVEPESVIHVNANIKLYSQIIENNNLKIYFPENDTYIIKIYDIQGNQIYQKEKEFGPENNFVGTSENLNLSHGIFIVKIVDSKNNTKTFKIAVK